MVATSILIGMMVAQTVMSVYGSYKAGKAAKKAGEAGAEVTESQAKLAEYNASVADLQAKDAVQRAAESESNFRSGVRGMIGAQRAGFAAGNIDVAYGSAIDVQADAAYLGELDALTIRTNGVREAWGFKVQAQDLRTRAAIARKEGTQILAEGASRQTAARWEMAGTILGASASLAGAKYGTGKGSRSTSSVAAVGSTRNYSAVPLSGPSGVHT
jgi:hypothetical protein